MNMLAMKVLSFIVFAFLVGGSFGQSIWTNPITGTSPGLTNPYTTGQTVHPNISVSGIGRGAGVNGNAGNDRYNTNSWNTGAIDLTAYFEWTLTPNVGCEIDFTSFVYTSQRNDASIANFAFRSSIDGFGSDIGTPTFGGTTINLTAGAYQNITGSITFRFYAWGADASTRTFSINDFTFNGSTSCAANPEPTNHPTAFGCSTISSSEIDLGWTDATGGQEPDGYLIKWSDVSYADITNPTDGSTANGANSTTVAQGIGTASITGLTQNTTYFFKIYPYTNSGSAIDYKTNGTIQQTDCESDEAPCISESFNNIPTGSPTNYLTRSWIGDDGFTFTTTDSRTDQSINGQSVTIRNGVFSGFGITGGIGDLTITTRRDFAGVTGNLTVSINGVDFGFIPYDGTLQSFTLTNINVSGVFDIKITTPGNGDRITIDDLSWTCFTSPNTLSWLNLSSPNFVLECQNSVTGSLDFEATGTFDAGNTIYVQLSDATGSFDNPLNIGSLSTTALTSSIPFTIPAGTPAELITESDCFLLNQGC
jgi:trimeric autotransporter adhesin